uniref:Uncharacterized protein n=1 Tax=Steinernema glaseri TaxID=37863 RepID=A0A1I7Z7F7_9BILA
MLTYTSLAISGNMTQRRLIKTWSGTLFGKDKNAECEERKKTEQPRRTPVSTTYIVIITITICRPKGRLYVYVAIELS